MAGKRTKYLFFAFLPEFMTDANECFSSSSSNFIAKPCTLICFSPALLTMTHYDKLLNLKRHKTRHLGVSFLKTRARQPPQFNGASYRNLLEHRLTKSHSRVCYNFVSRRSHPYFGLGAGFDSAPKFRRPKAGSTQFRASLRSPRYLGNARIIMRVLNGRYFRVGLTLGPFASTTKNERPSRLERPGYGDRFHIRIFVDI